MPLDVADAPSPAHGTQTVPPPRTARGVEVGKEQDGKDGHRQPEGTAREVGAEQTEGLQKATAGEVLGDGEGSLTHNAAAMGDGDRPHNVSRLDGSGQPVPVQNELVGQLTLHVQILGEVDLQILGGHHVGLGLADTRHAHPQSVQGIPRREHLAVAVVAVGPGYETVGLDVGGDQLSRPHVQAPQDDAEVRGTVGCLVDRDHAPAALVSHTRVHALATAVVVVLAAVGYEGVAVGEDPLLRHVGGGDRVGTGGADQHVQLVGVGLAGDEGDVTGCGAHGGIVESRGVGVAGVEGAQPLGLGIHGLHEGGHRSRREAGHHVSGVVVASADGGVEEIADRQLLPVGQMHTPPRDPRYHGGGDGDLLVQAVVQGTAGQKPHHDLDRGGGVDVGVGFLFIQGEVVLQIQKQHHPHVGRGGGILGGDGQKSHRKERRQSQENRQETQKGTPTQTARPRMIGTGVSGHGGVLLSGMVN